MGDYDKLRAGYPIEANVIQPRMREHKPARSTCREAPPVDLTSVVGEPEHAGRSLTVVH